MLSEEELQQRFNRWLQLVQEMHEKFHFTANEAVAWTPLTKPLREARLALVTTAGVHMRRQPPFNLSAPEGDWSFREIPWDAEAADLSLSHAHYDTEPAQQDIDCVFPIRTVRALAAEGAIGGLAPTFYGFMGFIPDGRPLLRETVPRLVERLRADGVDVVLLTPG